MDGKTLRKDWKQSHNCWQKNSFSDNLQIHFDTGKHMKHASKFQFYENLEVFICKVAFKAALQLGLDINGQLWLVT